MRYFAFIMLAAAAVCDDMSARSGYLTIALVCWMMAEDDE